MEQPNENGGQNGNGDPYFKLALISGNLTSGEEVGWSVAGHTETDPLPVWRW